MSNVPARLRPLRITVGQDLGVLVAALGTMACVAVLLLALTPVPDLTAVIASFVVGVVVGNLCSLRLRRAHERELRRFDDLVCPDCRYPLHPTAKTGRCTECGRDYDVRSVQEYWRGEA